MVSEDILESGDIQANIIPGLKMPYQYLIACKVPDKKKFSNWLKSNLSAFTTMNEAMGYHEERVAKAKALNVFGKESFLLPSEKGLFWLNVSFGSTFMNLFSPKPAKIDDSYRIGLMGKSSTLGDPKDVTQEGNPAKWVVGGVGKEADCLFITASDNANTLANEVDKLKNDLTTSGMTIVYLEQGERLNNDTEHFGFRDSISQPSPRGYMEDGKTYITERKIKSGNDNSSAPEFASPGDVLVWPGQFVFGYQKQDASDFRSPVAATDEEKDKWLKNGSLLVFRRLKQNVEPLYTTAKTMYDELITNSAFQNLQFEDFLSKFVGRKKDGTPNIFDGQTTTGQDINNFFYHNDTPAVTMNDGTNVSAVKGDTTNNKCPMFAHIRKVNPRDNGTDQGGPTDTLTFRILRRGISFGPPYNYQDSANPVNQEERGLLFLCYQTSIQGQFELLVSKWMNSDSAPEPLTQGYDMLVGQNGQDGQNRQRSATMQSDPSDVECPITTMTDFIIPTGGGYFFTPSISVLQMMASTQ